MKNRKVINFITGVCIATLVFFMITIVIRFFTRQVLVEKVHMDNVLIDLIFIGNEELKGNEESMEIDEQRKDIAWEKFYPFHNDKVEDVQLDDKTVVERYVGMMEAIERSIEFYSNDLLVGYFQFVQMARKYESAIGWNLSVYSDYNSVVKLEDGHLTEYYEKKDVSENIESVVSLYEYCEENGTEFLYVQAPFKISEYQDEEISGKLDFANQNANDLISGLEMQNIPVLDLREMITTEKLQPHELFYRTDHHWKAETGLWAAGIIAGYLNENYSFCVDLNMLAEDNFETVLYQDWFLGSYGKKVTLEQTEPEDISFLYPKFETMLHYEVPELEIDVRGDFSVAYDMECVLEKNYYDLNPYAAYNHGDRALIRINNENITAEKKILVIKDSFGNAVVPFLALGMKNVDVLDLRYFDGSVESYIEETRPDVVMVLYNPAAIGEINWETHKDLFDFR